MSTSIDQLASIEKTQKRLEDKKTALIHKALMSNDPHELIKATQALNGVQNKNSAERKTYFIDPYEFNSGFGYKDKASNMSYNMLRSMARTPIINAIIKTRINQIAAFCEPQKDEYSVGYVIRKKKTIGGKKDEKLTKQEEAEIDQLTKFIENCGRGDIYGMDDFDTFVRKIMRDSLTFDQMAFEIVPDRKGVPVEFYAVDGSTVRLAEDYSEVNNFNQKYQAENRPQKIKGYYPTYVQIFNDQVFSQFYPWEMCLGMRNPSNSIYNYGYGISELEELVTVVTSLLWGEEYNRNFFKQGSAPKGILKVSGSFGDAQLQQFRQQWNATMRGVSNSWKTPVMEADKMDWIDLQRNNQDMEFTQWIEFLIKVACAVFTIDPAEINFPLQGGADQNPMFEGNNEARLKHSRDRGLYPLLKFIQSRIQKFIIGKITDKYEFVFVGLDAMSRDQMAEYQTKLVNTSKTFNEIREMNGDDPVENGDIIGNSTYLQYVQAQQQAEQAPEEGDPDAGGAEGGEGEEEGTGDPEDAELEGLLGDPGLQKAGNPFVNALNNYLKTKEQQ